MLGGSEYRDKLGYIKPGTRLLVGPGVRHQHRLTHITARDEPCIVLGHYPHQSLEQIQYRAVFERREIGWARITGPFAFLPAISLEEALTHWNEEVREFFAKGTYRTPSFDEGWEDG